MRNTTLLLATLLGLACNHAGDSGSDTAASTSQGTTTDDRTTTGSSDGASTSVDATSTTTGSSDDGGTGAAPLTPDALVGTFTSASCEAYPDGNGGNNYLERSFTLTTSTWHLELDLFMDDACTVPLFSSVIDGPYELGGLSPAVAGATEGQFGLASNVWTAHQQFMADLFTDSGCAAAPWEVDVAQDVSATGCIGVAHPIDECPQEYDVVALDGDDLYFGERITDMCVPEGRPAALGPYPVVRE